MSDDSPLRSGVASPLRAGEPGTTLTRHIGRVSAIFDGAPIGVGVWSLEGRLLHANPVLCDLVQQPRDQLVGEPLERFLDRAHLGLVRKLLDELCGGERNALQCAFRCQQPDGSEWWLTAHVTGIYGGAGRPEYLISQIFSFVDSRLSQSVAEQLASESPAMLWLADDGGIPRVGNRRSYEFLGVADASTGLGRGLFETMHSADFERVRRDLQERMRNREDFEFTARALRGDGEWRLLHHRGTAIAGLDGEFAGYACASIDVTGSRICSHDVDEEDRLVRGLIESGPLAIARCDSKGRVVYANERWTDVFDNPRASLEGMNWQRIMPKDQVAEVIRRAEKAAVTGEQFTMRVRALTNSVLSIPGVHDQQPGTQFWGDLTVAPTYADGVLDGFIATLTDVSAEMAAGSRVDQLARVLDAGSDYLMIIERNMAISYVNDAASEMLGIRGVTDDEEAPMFLMDVLDADSYEFFHDVIEPALVFDQMWRGELSFRRPDGQDVPASAVFLAHSNDDGRFESISVVARDISDLKAAHAKLQELATHDYLTGLPNRVLLYDRLEQALARFCRYGQPVALLYVDLDRFKPVNDQLGHHIGDEVLVRIADRIHSVVRDTDTAARIGGDEFAVLVEGLGEMGLLRNVARRLIRRISEPMTIGEAEAQVGASIGLVVADAQCAAPDALMALADSAMYRAKASGRGRFVVLGSDGQEGG